MATALPTIVAKLGGGKDYSWVGRSVRVVSFMVSFIQHGSPVAPIYSLLLPSVQFTERCPTFLVRPTDMYAIAVLTSPLAGRKPVLFFSIAIFLVRFSRQVIRRSNFLLTPRS